MNSPKSGAYINAMSVRRFLGKNILLYKEGTTLQGASTLRRFNLDHKSKHISPSLSPVNQALRGVYLEQIAKEMGPVPCFHMLFRGLKQNALLKNHFFCNLFQVQLCTGWSLDYFPTWHTKTSEISKGENSRNYSCRAIAIFGTLK